MAQFVTSSPSGSTFMGNPIVYDVRSAAIAGDKVSFHRVKMDVIVTDGIHTSQYELSQPIAGKESQDVAFDISSCFRAAANLYQYKPVVEDDTYYYPQFTATCTVYDVWVEDGQAMESQGDARQTQRYEACMGSLSDYERRLGSYTATYTRKPSVGELAYPGDNVVYAAREGNMTMACLQPLTVAPYSTQDIGTHRLTVIPANDRHSRQFQFVNSRGVVESIRAFGLPSEKVMTESQKQTVSRFERFNEFCRTLIARHTKPSEFAMCSGYVDYQWARWWAYEFCQARQHWMLTDDDIWLPVTVEVKSGASVIDHAKPGLCYVEFTVTPDINGAIW